MPLHFPLEIIFILLGLVLILRGKPSPYLLLWALLAPVPAALTESSNAQRAIAIFPLPIFLSAYGLSNLRFQKLFLLALAASFGFYLHTYLIKLPKNPIYSQRVNYKEAFTKAISLADKYDSVHFSRVFTVPHIFVAFYSKWDPADFQKYSQDWRRYEKADKLYVDQLESWNLGKYEFHDFHWEREGKLQNALLVSSFGDFPASQHILFDLADYRFAVINPR